MGDEELYFRTSNKYKKIRDVINSCKTIPHILTCRAWVRRIIEDDENLFMAVKAIDNKEYWLVKTYNQDVF